LVRFSTNVCSPRTRALRRGAGMADDPHEFNDGFFEELRDVYSEAAISELLVFAGIEVGLDRFCIALTLDTTKESEYTTDPEYPADPHPRETND